MSGDHGFSEVLVGNDLPTRFDDIKGMVQGVFAYNGSKKEVVVIVIRERISTMVTRLFLSTPKIIIRSTCIWKGYSSRPIYFCIHLFKRL